MNHRDPPMPSGIAPFGQCPWCAVFLIAPPGKKIGQRRWHPECVRTYRIAAFSSDQRQAVQARDKGVCAACGVVAREPIGWEADHIRPLWSRPAAVALADRDAWWGMANLQTLCRPCHVAKCAREATERAAGRRPQAGLFKPRTPPRL